MTQSFKNHPNVVSVVVFLITICVSFFGYKTLKARDNADELATQTSEVLSHIDEVLLGLVNMETGLRGYMLTGNNEMLNHYFLSKSQYEVTIKRLISLTKGSHTLEEHWSSVATLAQEWETNWAAKGIQMRQDMDAGKISNDTLSSHVIAERDESTMDAIRAELNAGRQEETGLLVGQLIQGQEADYRAYYVMVAGMVVTLLLGVLTGATLNRANIEKAKQIQMQHLLYEEREKERLQLARDLHDGPVQELMGLTFTIQGLVSDDLSPEVIESLKTIKSSLQSTMSELRASAKELRSPILTKFGLQKAIRADLDNFQQKYPEIKVHFSGDEKEERLSELQQASLFRIYQEEMRNILRHSKAREVNIQFHVSDKNAVFVTQDDGVGFTLPGDWLMLAQEGHFGLAGIREQTEAIGGRLEIHTRPKEGTTIRITIPIKM